jgi:hypothetical protein
VWAPEYAASRQGHLGRWCRLSKLFVGDPLVSNRVSGLALFWRGPSAVFCHIFWILLGLDFSTHPVRIRRPPGGGRPPSPLPRSSTCFVGTLRFQRVQESPMLLIKYQIKRYLKTAILGCLSRTSAGVRRACYVFCHDIELSNGRSGVAHGQSRRSCAPCRWRMSFCLNLAAGFSLGSSRTDESSFDLFLCRANGFKGDAFFKGGQIQQECAIGAISAQRRTTEAAQRQPTVNPVLNPPVKPVVSHRGPK